MSNILLILQNIYGIPLYVISLGSHTIVGLEWEFRRRLIPIIYCMARLRLLWPTSSPRSSDISGDMSGFRQLLIIPLPRGECFSPTGWVAIQASAFLICFGQNPFGIIGMNGVSRSDSLAAGFTPILWAVSAIRNIFSGSSCTWKMMSNLIWPKLI